MNFLGHWLLSFVSLWNPLFHLVPLKRFPSNCFVIYIFSLSISFSLWRYEYAQQRGEAAADEKLIRGYAIVNEAPSFTARNKIKSGRCFVCVSRYSIIHGQRRVSQQTQPCRWSLIIDVINGLVIRSDMTRGHFDCTFFQARRVHLYPHRNERPAM